MRAVVQRVSRAKVTVKVTVSHTSSCGDSPCGDGAPPRALTGALPNAPPHPTAALPRHHTTGEVIGEIGLGLLVLLAVGTGDTRAEADYLVQKIIGLRIFENAAGKMNLSVAEVAGALLVVSQFTLYGDARRGKRPSFDAAAPPEQARELYEYFVEKVRAAALRCETGRFQETMQVELVNEGPVTILLDSAKSF